MNDRELQEWEKGWELIGKLSEVDLSKYSKDIGVYRADLNGELKYNGRAMEKDNGGFRKRLRDYTRDSDSARKHSSGQKMFKFKDELDISIIRTSTEEEAIKLERALIDKYKPEWNDR